MKKRNWLLFLLSIPVVLLASGLLRKPSGQNSGAQITVARLGSLEERADGSGTLEGVRRVEVSAARAGMIETVEVNEGDTVSAGQLLLTLEKGDAAAGLEEAGAQVRISAIALGQAERQQARVLMLFEAGLSSTEEAALADESVMICRAELARANASRAQAYDAWENTSYHAPIDGIVTALNVEAGETAVVGTMNNAGTVLLTIEDMSGFLVRVTMVESEVVNVQQGMIAEATLDALPDMVFPGVVERVGLASTNDGDGSSASKYEVLVRLSETDPRMRSGMSASVEVVTARNDSCVIVPIQSIVRRSVHGSNAVSSVLVVKNGRVVVVPVETGVKSIMEIEVLGVTAGDSIVSGPTELLRTLQDGDPLQAAGGGQNASTRNPGFPPVGR
jgi:HlyD family secretion protein